MLTRTACKGDTATAAGAVAVYAPWANVGCELGPWPSYLITLKISLRGTLYCWILACNGIE